jgi:hypothetical protein
MNTRPIMFMAERTFSALGMTAFTYQNPFINFKILGEEIFML